MGWMSLYVGKASERRRDGGIPRGPVAQGGGGETNEGFQNSSLSHFWMRTYSKNALKEYGTGKKKKKKLRNYQPRMFLTIHHDVIIFPTHEIHCVSSLVTKKKPRAPNKLICRFILCSLLCQWWERANMGWRGEAVTPWRTLWWPVRVTQRRHLTLAPV